MKKRSLLLLFLSLCWMTSFAQDISGKWKGNLTQGPGGFASEYYFEMNLKQKENIISGTSFISYNGNQFSGLMSVRGTFDGTYFYYEDIKILSQKGMTDSTAWCIKKCRFALKKIGDNYELSGNWTGQTAFGYCTPGTVRVGQKAAKESVVLTDDKKGSEGTNEGLTRVMIKTVDDESKSISANLEIRRKGRGSQKGRSVDGQHVFTLESGSYHVVAKESGYYDYTQDIELKASDKELNVLCTLKKIREGDRFEIENLHFDRSKATITQESRETLNKLVEFMNTNSKVNIQINGHTDNVGSNYLNRLLSFNRANAVVAYLVKNGISQSRLKAKGHGSEIPIADNNTAAGRAQNRRVEIEVVGLD